MSFTYLQVYLNRHLYIQAERLYFINAFLTHVIEFHNKYDYKIKSFSQTVVTLFCEIIRIFFSIIRLCNKIVSISPVKRKYF